MKIQHLGTAAAERIPGVFCKCDICVYAAKKGGKEIRTQSQALIDDALLLDFPADTYYHYQKFQFPLPDITELFITHWHSDHFYGEDLAFRMNAYASNQNTLMTVHGSEMVYGFYIRALFLEQQQDLARLTYHLMKPGDQIKVLGKYTVYAFEAVHGHRYGDCLFYGVTDGKSSLLYAHDTGYFSESTWQQLSDANLVYDYVSLDCTHGNLVASETHMNLADNAKVKEKLLDLGLATTDTHFVANHFSHNAKSNHDQLVSIAKEIGFSVSYDGYTAEF